MKTVPQVREREIPKTVFRDIHWWLTFMPEFNGISAIPDPKWVGLNALFSTDTSRLGRENGLRVNTSMSCFQSIW